VPGAAAAPQARGLHFALANLTDAPQQFTRVCELLHTPAIPDIASLDDIVATAGGVSWGH